MASETHLAILKQGAAAWNKWRGEEPSMVPDLIGASLTIGQKQWSDRCGGPIDFHGARLASADFSNATLIGSNLDAADLGGANLSSARLQHASLRSTNLSHASFQNADIESACFEGAVLKGADLSRARNLQASQIATAFGDASTLLPNGMERPEAWSDGRGRAEAEAPPLPEAAPILASAPPLATVAAERPREIIGVKDFVLVAAPAMSADGTENSSHAGRSTGLLFGFAGLTLFFCTQVTLFPQRPESPLHYDAIAREVATASAHEQPHHAIVEAAKAAVPVQIEAELKPVTPASAQNLNSSIPPESVALLGADRFAESVRVAGTMSVTPLHALPPVMTVAVSDGGATARTEKIGLLGTDQIAEQPVGDGPAPQAIPVMHEVGAIAQSQPVTAPAKPEPELPRFYQPDPKAMANSVDKTAVPASVASPPTGKHSKDPAKAKNVAAKEVSKPAAVTAPAAAKPKTLDYPSYPGTLFEFLAKSERSPEWIQTFIERYYLSSDALDKASLQRVYSDRVDYFGTRDLSVREVARAQERYNRQWPIRRFQLVPGSMAIRWKTPDVAEVSFKYRFDVSAPNAGASTGRGRAQLTLDFSGQSAHIIGEDGDVLVGNAQ